MGCGREERGGRRVARQCLTHQACGEPSLAQTPSLLPLQEKVACGSYCTVAILMSQARRLSNVYTKALDLSSLF